ncbi:MAG: tetratricopeptide repeat protein [Gemmataceae bacterium]
MRAPVLGFLFPALFFATGCGSKPTAVAPDIAAPKSDPAAELAAIQETLRKPANDVSQYRQALDQLNAVLAKMPEKQPKPLTGEQGDKLRKVFGLTDAEITEVNRAEFGPLDAHYLYDCTTLREVARTLGVEKPTLNLNATADAALQWTMRHIRIEERKGSLEPPTLVINRGRGTQLERTIAFAEIMRQAGVSSLFLGDPGAATDATLLWGVGPFAEGQCVAVDPRAGLVLPVIWPVPCAAGKPNDPEKLRKWNGLNYDVNEKRITACKVFPALQLQELAPRIKTLEELETGVHLAEPRASQDASPDISISSSTFRLLSEMYPPEEGGTDRAPPGQRRIDRYRFELIPWDLLPPELLQIPGPIGMRVRQIFGDTTILTHQRGIAQALKEKQQFVESLQSEVREIGDSKTRAQIIQGESQQFRPSVEDSTAASIRQLILRGKYDEATAALVMLGDGLRTLRGKPEGAATKEAAVAWAKKITEPYAEYLRAQRSKDVAAITKAQQALDALQKEGQPVLEYVQWQAAGYVLSDVTYLTALCKHDQAEIRFRREPTADSTKSAARTAAQAWGMFISNYPDSPALGHALRMQARCQELSGDRPAAAETYKRAAAKLAEPEKAACLILADQLKT